MSTHTAIFEYYAGATLDAGSLLCHRTTDATVKTAESTGEKNVGGAVYEAVFEDIAEGGGSYRLKFKAGGEVVGTRLVRFTGTDGEVVETVAVELDSATIRAALGMATADLDTQLDAILAGAGGSGTGARTVTITVNDGTTALQNATVRMTEGANTFTALTNVSGIAVFNLDDATYTVSITKSGYSYAGTTLVVNGTETATYSMTVVSVASPTNPDLSAIEVLCLGADFTASSNIDIDFRMAVIPSSDQNNAFPGAKVTVTSNASGIARWEAPQGAAIEYKRGRADVWTRVTLDSDGVTNVTSVIGSP